MSGSSALVALYVASGSNKPLVKQMTQEAVHDSYQQKAAPKSVKRPSMQTLASSASFIKRGNIPVFKMELMLLVVSGLYPVSESIKAYLAGTPYL